MGTKLTNSTKDKIKDITNKIQGDKQSKSSNTSNSAITPSKTDLSVIPGLPNTLTPNQVSGVMPKFNDAAYNIDDPLNPSDSLPQATISEYDRGMTIYEGTQRALKLVGAAMDTTAQKFVVINKQAKAYGEGVKAATQIEKVRGDYTDYLNQVQVNQQKDVALDVNTHKTTVETDKAVHSKATLDEQLKQAEKDAELARAKTREKQNKLDEFLKELGEITVS
jgi:hypothetical protein